MTITRDEKAIKLTSEELRAAYYEQQHNFDIDDIDLILDEYVQAADELPHEAEQARGLLSDRAKMSEMALEKHSILDHDDDADLCAARSVVSRLISALLKSQKTQQTVGNS